MSLGRCYGVGVGPGDPELMTLKAARLLEACPVVAYFSAVGKPSNARQVAEGLLGGGHLELHLVYPVTTEVAAGAGYEGLLLDFYDESAARVATELEAGRDVVVLCEGDPFFHGSFMYLYNRLAPKYPTEVVPGVPAMLAGSASIGAPLVCRDEVLDVLPATLGPDQLEARLRRADVAVVMKVGRHLAEVRAAIERAGLLERAWYVERASMGGERVVPLSDVHAAEAPYFSMVVIPEPDRRRPVSGRLAVVGLGPGAVEWRTPEAAERLAGATDLVGYQPYLELAGPLQAGRRAHPFDNRQEAARAAFALDLAASGRDVVLVSSGDPGIFAMAAAVVEALHEEASSGRWDGVEVTVVPGVTAASAAAARVGAPLGHDLCLISLSDVLKPWAVVERRLRAAAEADFALALYNPTSAHRPWQLRRALEIVGQHRVPATPVVVARNVGRAGESVTTTVLADVDPAEVDMRTVLLVGSSTTQSFVDPAGRAWVYTPRQYPGSDGQAED